ncbi:MAG: sel1 repeat family protein [Sphingomonadales bacterium]|nr:sel1 repeat family protein [Sphingomonadales bacterium]
MIWRDLKRMNRRGGAAILALSVAMLAGSSAWADVKAGVDAWSRGDYAAAVHEWQGYADKGDADAQFNLAQAYKLGRGVPQDLAKAEALYGKAAAQGHVQAGDNYGLLLFQRGEHGQAMPYIKAGAEHGDPRAQYLYGIALFNGDGVTKDWVRAYALVSLAQQQGLPQATPALGQMDQYIPLDQRQKAVSVATELAAQSEANRQRQFAAMDLGTKLPAAGTRVAAATPPAPTTRAPVAAPPPVMRAPAYAPPPAPVTRAPAYAPAASGTPIYTPSTRYPAPTPGYTPPPAPTPSYLAPTLRGLPPAPAMLPRGNGRPVQGTFGSGAPVDAAPAPAPAPRPAVRPAPVRSAPVREAAADTGLPAGGSGNWKIQLGAFGVAGNADAQWARVHGRPEVAGHARVNLKSGAVTRLLAGGYSESGAKAACGRLSAAGIACIAVGN